VVMIFRKLIRLVKQIGIVGTVFYIFFRFTKPRHSFLLLSKRARYPLLCRSNTSDLNVFREVFIEREYSCLDDVFDASFIVDCGANVGYSSAYLLNRFPNSFVVAIEPDPENYSVMKENLKPYKNQVQMLNSAIWSHSAPLKMSEQKYRDGKEWSRQVRECKPGETALFSGVDIGTLLKESGRERISILKMDIEGSEAVVFSNLSPDGWINQVDVIVIELHDDSSFGKCREVFFSAISNKDFNISYCGELTVCKKKKKFS
jgi:FkbM family methyltransferase